MDTSVLIARLTPPKLVYILNNCGCLNAYRQSESGKSYQTYLNCVYINQRYKHTMKYVPVSQTRNLSKV